MAKYRHYDYTQRTLIPVSLQEQLVPGTLEFAIPYLVEERVDNSVFDERYQNDETERWAYDPKVLLKIVLFGYSRAPISSRKLEQACRENVTFMALACGQSSRTTAPFQRLSHRWRGRSSPCFGMCCWSVRRWGFWVERCLPWMAASSPATPPRSGAVRYRI